MNSPLRGFLAGFRVQVQIQGYRAKTLRALVSSRPVGLAQIMGVTPGRVSQIVHGEDSTVEALASYIAALGGELELVANIGGHLLKVPASPVA
jgi:hypothetical protein